MAMLPNTNMARGSSWGGFGYKLPQQRQPQTQAGMGAYANAGNTPPSAFGGAQPMQSGVMQSMGQRTLTPEMAAQYKPQMMASALMQQPGAPAGSTPVQLGNSGNWGYATPEQQAANAAAPQMGTVPAPNTAQLSQAQAMPNMAQPAQAQPAMQRPMPVPRGYAR